VRLQVAAFTNLTHDHLDYHKDEVGYFKAKSRLFTDLLPHDGTAILNADDPASIQLAALLKDRSIRVVTYGSKNADIQYVVDSLHGEGQDISLSVFGTPYKVHFPLIGNFQVSNGVCALANVILTGVDEASAVANLSRLNSVPGRLQKVTGRSGHGIKSFASSYSWKAFCCLWLWR
jgi:UDP-N-acetylmuramoyl-L-alanyl-D-glutamate--2,6-diaminopimelate ligase